MDNAKIVELMQRIDEGKYDEMPLYSYREMHTLRDSRLKGAFIVGFIMGVAVAVLVISVLFVQHII